MWVSETFLKATEKVLVPLFSSFGTYEQDGDLSNGQEPIEWQVAEIQDDKALLVSKYALDLRQYHPERTGVTWEACDLRNWLNTSFFDTAFSEEEKGKILFTKVKASHYINTKGNAGNDTFDTVFLLSIDDIKSLPDTFEKKCLATEYVKGTSAVISNMDSARWWLRSTGIYQHSASYINYNGSINGVGNVVDSTDIAVRPAIWVSIHTITKESSE